MSAALLAAFSKDVWSPQEPTRLTALQSLTQLLPQDLVYAQTRILAGLESFQDESRLGYGVALAQLFRLSSTDQILELLDASLHHLDNNLPREKVVALPYLISAAIIAFPTPDNVLLSRILQLAVQLSLQKQWLQDAMAFVILDLLSNLLLQESISTNTLKIIREAIFGDDAWNATKTAIAIYLQAALDPAYQKELSWKDAIPLKNPMNILDTKNGPQLNKLLQNQLTAAYAEDSTPTNPSCIWYAILKAHQIRPLLLGDLFHSIIGSSFLSNSASTSAKHNALLTLQTIWPQCTLQCKEKILDSTTLKTILHYASTKDLALHDLANRVMQLIIQGMQKHHSTATTLTNHILALTLSNEHLVHPLIQSKLLEQIWPLLNAKALSDCTKNLQNVAFSSTNTSSIKTRRWAIDQLAFIFRKSARLSESERSQLQIEILQLFLINGLFTAQRSLPTSHKFANVAFTGVDAQIRELAEAKAFTLLKSTSSNVSAGGHMLRFAVEVISSLQADPKYFQTAKIEAAAWSQIEQKCSELLPSSTQTFVDALMLASLRNPTQILESIDGLLEHYEGNDSDPMDVLDIYLDLMSNDFPFTNILSEAVEKLQNQLGDKTAVIKMLLAQLIEEGPDEDEGEHEENSATEDTSFESSAESDEAAAANLNEAALVGRDKVVEPENDANSVSSDEESLLDDEQMAAMDSAISAAVSTKADRKAEETKIHHYRLRILDLLEILCFSKSNTSPASIVLCLKPLLSISLAEEARVPKELSTKSARILQKCCRALNADTDLESIKQFLEYIHSAITKRGSVRLTSLLASINSLSSRQLVSQGQIDYVVRLHQEALHLYARKKASNTRLAILSPTLQTLPDLAWCICETLTNLVAGKVITSFRRYDLVKLLGELIKKGTSASRSPSERQVSLVQAAVSALFEVWQKAAIGNDSTFDWTKNKEVSKTLLALARLTKEVAPASIPFTFLDRIERLELLLPKERSQSLALLKTEVVRIHEGKKRKGETSGAERASKRRQIA